jgi:hypothetical protein
MGATSCGSICPRPPSLLTGPFHSGLVVAFVLAAVLAAAGAVVSLFRGGVYIHDESAS